MKTLFFFLVIAITHNAVTAQNVGIGTTTPTEKLQVTGNIKADTIKPNGIKLTPNAGTGKILISDAAGVGTWQASSMLAGAGNIGYGVWGDCATNGNISEYQPVADATGATGDLFGTNVAISGNFAIIGASQDDVGTNSAQGSASIYQWNGGSWVLMQKITDATGDIGDRFGISVSISGNYAIIGAYLDDVGANSSQGSASIYQWNGSSWVLMQKITDASGAAFDQFGRSVSISGNYAIIGADGDEVGANASQGSASIYQWNGSNWVLMQKITDAAGEANDDFGSSVSISGSYAIIGAFQDDEGGITNAGSASIYVRFLNGWLLQAKITDAVGAQNDFFGNNVSISGSYAIIGSFQDDVSLNTNQGSASIYKREGSSWVLMKKMTDGGGAAEEDFGTSVCISEDYAIVGARYGKGMNGTPGTVFIYLRVGFGWQLLQKVTDPGSTGSESFGVSVAIDGNIKRFLCGANGYGLSSGKVLFGKIN
ncbi:MAG: FG-GAP repeat protein [Bacteroidota bacterium]